MAETHSTVELYELDDRQVLEVIFIKLQQLDRKVDQMNAGLEALQAKVDELATEDTELLETVEQVATDFQTIESELTSLQSTAGTTDEELAPVTEAVSTAAANVSAAIAKLHAAEPPAAPAGPVTTPQAVYLFLGPGTPEAPWSEAPFVTAEAFTDSAGTVRPEGSTLYYDANDTPGSTPPTEAGVGTAGWEIYKGAVKE
jgi:uncharacterized protein YoxC